MCGPVVALALLAAVAAFAAARAELEALEGLLLALADGAVLGGDLVVEGRAGAVDEGVNGLALVEDGGQAWRELQLRKGWRT